MVTKDDLTRDEAREAIQILKLRRDNLDSIMFDALGILIAFISLDFLIISYLKMEFSLFVLVGIIFVASCMGTISILAFCWVRKIDKKANKLAKDYKLEKFFDAISYEKNKILKCVLKVAVAVLLILVLIFVVYVLLGRHDTALLFVFVALQ